MKLSYCRRLVKSKARQVAVCAGEGEAVAFSRAGGGRTVCSAGQSPCLLLFCWLWSEIWGTGRPGLPLMPHMASVLIKLTADWISGDIEACRRQSQKPPGHWANSSLLETELFPIGDYKRDSTRVSLFCLGVAFFLLFHLANCYVCPSDQSLTWGSHSYYSASLRLEPRQYGPRVDALNCWPLLPPWEAQKLNKCRCGSVQYRP